jgi:hypothetical protein
VRNLSKGIALSGVFLFSSLLVAAAPEGEPSWLDESQWPAFVADRRLEVNADDDALQRLLIERFNAAQEELRERYLHWLQGEGRLDWIGDVPRRVVVARLEVPAPAADLPALLKEQAEFARVVERQAEALLKKHNKAKNAADAKCARYFRLDAEIALLRAERGFQDDWKRPDGPLGNGWCSAHDDHSKWWDPLELYEGTPVNTNPDQGPIAQPDNAAGRTAAYRDFGPESADNFTVGTWWNGKHHAVAAPVACINLDEPDWGLAFCYEPQIAGGVYVLWALGRRPNEIRVVKAGPGQKKEKHRDGVPMFLEMHVRGENVTCLADGEEVLTSPIPEALRGSKTHGFCLDVNPVPGRPPRVKVIGGPFVIAPLKP